MNVMAQAHKATREAIQASGCKGLNYRALFIAALKDFHRINKEQRAMSPTANIIKETQEFIAKLEAVSDLSGYIVVVGEHHVCTNAEIGQAVGILFAPKYDNIEDARYFASRVQNGKGERGQVVTFADELAATIKDQREFIKTLESM